MEVGFWATRVNSSKNIPFALSSRHNTNNINHHHVEAVITRLKEGEGSTSWDEECSELDWHSQRTEKDMEKPKNTTRSLSKSESLKLSLKKLESLKLSLEKLQLSCRERNLLSNSSDDDARVCIACPLCDINIEVVVLHSHLQEDHGFEFKNAVCPLCAANLGKDITGHFITNHTTSLKFRRKSKTSGLWTTTSAMLGKGLSSFLGSYTNGKGNALESAPDPLLSPFLSRISDPEPKQKLLSESCGNSSSLSRPLKSAEPSFVNSNNGVDNEERRQRASFVRQLIASSIF